MSLLDQRLGLLSAFESRESVLRLVRGSGGHVRDLLDLVDAAVFSHYTSRKPLPIPDAVVLDVLRTAQGRRLPFGAGPIGLLDRIRDGLDPQRTDDEAWEHLVGLFEQFMDGFVPANPLRAGARGPVAGVVPVGPTRTHLGLRCAASRRRASSGGTPPPCAAGQARGNCAAVGVALTASATRPGSTAPRLGWL